MVPLEPIRIRGIAAGRLKTGNTTIPQADLLERALVNVKMVPKPIETKSIKPVKTRVCSNGQSFKNTNTAKAQMHIRMEIIQE